MSVPDDYPADFEKLVHATRGRLAGYLFGMSGGDRHLVEDVLNEAFAALWLQWHRPEIRDRHPDRYLRVVARRLLFDALRNRDRRPTPHPAIPDLPPPGLTAEPASEQVDDRARLRWSLAQLPPRERETIILRYYLGYSVAETAEAMQITPGAVKSYASTGRRKLQEYLRPDQSDRKEGHR